jgi:hypothetical protein
VAGGSGAATASYTTAALVVGDNNKLFRCRVGDGVKPPDAYQYSGTALLHVQPVLSLAGLTGANLIENSPIALSVTPTGGYAPLSYQWEFNPGTGWVNLGGPTPSATYSVANAFFVNEGQYRVTVTDNLSTTAAAGPVTVTVLEISADPAWCHHPFSAAASGWTILNSSYPQKRVSMMGQRMTGFPHSRV